MKICDCCGYALDVRRVAWLVEGRLDGEIDLCGRCRMDLLAKLETVAVRRMRGARVVA